jgi:hypothetical protein
MRFDSSIACACVLFAASVAAFRLAGSWRCGPGLYLRFAAMLLSGLAVTACLGLAAVAALFLLPLAATSLAIAALGRFVRPPSPLAAGLMLGAALALGLGAALGGPLALALLPMAAAALVLMAAAFQGLAMRPLLSGAALLAALLLLPGGNLAGLMLFAAAALLGLARPDPSAAQVEARRDGCVGPRIAIAGRRLLG